MRRFAKAVGVDLRVFQRYFTSKHPRLETMTAIAKALGYPSSVARILSLTIRDRDVRGALDELVDELLEGSGFAIFGKNALAVRDRIIERIKSDQELQANFCFYGTLARFGLVRWLQPPDQTLGPYFGPINALLGNELFAFAQSKDQLVKNKHRSTEDVRRGLSELGIPEPGRTEVQRILERYEWKVEDPSPFRGSPLARAIVRKRTS